MSSSRVPCHLPCSAIRWRSDGIAKIEGSELPAPAGGVLSMGWDVVVTPGWPERADRADVAVTQTVSGAPTVPRS